MKKLTRILALTLCCLLALGLTACGEQPAPTPDPNEETGGNTQIPNPMVAYENAEFPDFALTGYPDRDGMRPTGSASSAAPSGRSPMKPPPCAAPPRPRRTLISPAFTTPMPKRASLRWDIAIAMDLSLSP